MTLPELSVTGAVTHLLTLNNHDLALGLFPIAASDTQTRRCRRWRVRPELVEQLPLCLDGLGNGRQNRILLRPQPQNAGQCTPSSTGTRQGS